MKLFVIMSNDFPAGVMQDGKAAEQLVEQRNTLDKEMSKIERRGRIYWRSYPFEL